MTALAYTVAFDAEVLQQEYFPEAEPRDVDALRVLVRALKTWANYHRKEMIENRH